jgi:hypothetical protein
MTESKRNAQVDAYIESLNPEQNSIVASLRELIHDAVPGCEEAFKWSRPIFGAGMGFAYIQANKAHINLGFAKGALLPDPQGLLEGTGKELRHVKIRSAEQVNPTHLLPLIQAAAKLAS